MKLLLALMVLGLSVNACSVKPRAEEASRRTMQIGGRGYVISLLTSSTWSATLTSPKDQSASGAPSTADLSNAIELASGCKVTHSNCSNQDMQLDAQVDCSRQVSR